MGTINWELTADEANAVKAVLKVADGLRKAGDEGEKAGHKSRSAFASATQGLQSYVMGMVGLGAALATVKTMLSDINRINKEAANKVKFSEMGMAQLAQLSGGDPKRQRTLMDTARNLYAGGGAKDLNEAARTVFSLESAGALGSAELFTRLYGIVGQPDVFARAGTTLLTSMGKQETGDIRAIASKAFAASKYSPASAEALLEAGSRSGAQARTLGISDEEVLAATAILATASGSAEQGGTQLNALLRSLNKKGGFAGKGLTGAIEALQAKRMNPQQMIKYLGRGEAFTALSALSMNMPQIGEIVEAQTQAQESDLVGRIMKARDVQPELAAAMGQRRSEAQLELARTDRGVLRLKIDTALNQWERDRELAGGNKLVTWVGRYLARQHQFLSGDEKMAEDLGIPVGRQPPAATVSPRALVAPPSPSEQGWDYYHNRKIMPVTIVDDKRPQSVNPSAHIED